MYHGIPICMYVCIYAYLNIMIDTNRIYVYFLFVHVFMYVCMHECLCMYVCMCMYTYIYIYISTRTHTWTSRSKLAKYPVGSQAPSTGGDVPQAARGLEGGQGGRFAGFATLVCGLGIW